MKVTEDYIDKITEILIYPRPIPFREIDNSRLEDNLNLKLSLYSILEEQIDNINLICYENNFDLLLCLKQLQTKQNMTFEINLDLNDAALLIESEVLKNNIQLIPAAFIAATGKFKVGDFQLSQNKNIIVWQISESSQKALLESSFISISLESMLERSNIIVISVN